MENTENLKAVELFNKLADSYQQRFFSVDAYQPDLDKFLNQIKPDSTVLDVACGPGNISHYLLKKRPDLNLLGVDLAPNMISLAQKNNPNAHFQVYDALKLDALNRSFDAVIVGFLFPYLSKEQVLGFLQHVHQVLNQEGILYLSTMEDVYENSRLRSSSNGEQVMMHYYESSFLSQTLENLGFEVLSVRTQDYVISENETDTDLIIIAKKRNQF
ncbi:class I SAM-dependent methyltransferase [Fluviicola sp.]|uniref:class I SAM-dependent methyltransferase n=1 Tax=Fluviicola sp. TaxID=1917219 RepID=UPI0026076A25|nr:class I SAM-dependent methyltransferase [Fluviicola sp.]